MTGAIDGKGRLGRLALCVGIALLAWAALAAPKAAADPVYTIKATWGDTNLTPGGEGQFVIQARNVGDTDGSGDLTITDQLPAGVTIEAIDETRWQGEKLIAPHCTGIDTSLLTCLVPADAMATIATARGVTNGQFTMKPTGYLPTLFVDVSIDAGTSGTGTNTATIEGGGAAAPASDVDEVPFSSTPSGFGLVPGGYGADVFSGAFPFGSPERQAGAHPHELRVDFDFNQETGTGRLHASEPILRYTGPHGRVRDVEVTLPRAMIGNPEATPKCKGADFAQLGVLLNATSCPASTQVGYLDIEFANGKSDHGYNVFGEAFHFGGAAMLTRVAIYNLEPPKGVPADFGFNAGGFVQGHIYPSLDPAQGYAIKTLSPTISSFLAVRGTRVTFWGVPGDPAHDQFRYHNGPFRTNPAAGAPFGSAAIKPLLTLPMDCGFENGGFRIRVASYQDPGNYTPVEETGNKLNVEGCEDERFRFEPEVELQPTSRDAGGPTGLNVDLKVPQRNDAVEKASELYAGNGDVQAIPTPPIKKAVVTFPEGMTLSASAAQGLGSCSSEQVGLGTDRPVSCPDNSQYGTLTLSTPLLPKDDPMQGFIYIAKQNDNPFNNFLSLYLVIEDTERGLLVKVPGKLDLDPKTGQITSSFEDLPQFPVSNIRMSFKGGARAGLVNPTTCGRKEIKAEFYSWHDPSAPHVVTDSYEVTQKPDGSPCVGDLSQRPFSPKMNAGTLDPNAGAYSPFVFRLTRTDDDQEFSQLSVTPPPGLLAKLAGVTECSDAAIAQAATPGRSGTSEQLFPSCPASSYLGSTEVGAGVGVPLTYIPGKAYLSGPYKGAPLSMVVITPVLTGPYDLGVIAVRSAIHVNAEVGQATVSTEPFPQVFEGIPVRIRDIRVKLDRPETTLNPTSCEPMAVEAQVTGTGGNLASTADDSSKALSERFQASNCASLPFKPKLGFRLKGGTKRGDFPAFQATLKARPGDANIARTQVILPRSSFIEQAHIRTVCTRVQFAADACPKGSIYGWAKAKSPLFDEPFEGPAYLRSNGGERLLPDLVIDLNGRIEVVLAGFVDSVNERVRNTFDVIPDAPVTSFTLKMQGGRKGLLVNSRNLCLAPSRANVLIEGHNGKTLRNRTKLGVACKGKQRKRR